MSYSRRLTGAFASVAVAALTLTACGSSGTPSGSSTISGSASGSAGATHYADLSGQTLEVAAVWSGSDQQNFTAVLRGFEQKTHASTTFTSTGNDLATVLGTRVRGGKAPDVAIMPNPGLLKQFATAGDLTVADSDVQAAVTANYAASWKTLATVKGTLYGVPFKAANKATVWYRTAAFSQAGISPPTTWSDFVKDLGTLADSGTTPLCVGGGDGWPLADFFQTVYLETAGPDKYQSLFVNRGIPWTDPSVTTALKDLQQVFRDKYIAGGLNGGLQTDFNTSVTDTFGANPKCAITYEGDFVAGVIDSNTKSKVGTDANFFPFPPIDSSVPPSIQGGGDFAVAMKTTKAAQELLKYLASPEAAEIWAAKGGYASANKNDRPLSTPTT